jgi:hypothetical protein
LVVTVTALAVYRPEALGGQRAPESLASDRRPYQNPTSGLRPLFTHTQDETENSSLPNISGTWDGYSPSDSGLGEKTSTLKIEQKTGSLIRAFVERRTPAGTRRFDYEGRFSAGQLVLFFEDIAGRGFIIGSMVLHLSSDLQTLTGKITYYHHDHHQVLATDRFYKRVIEPTANLEVATTAKSRRRPFGIVQKS